MKYRTRRYFTESDKALMWDHWQWLSRGYATIAVLDGNADAGESLRNAISGRLSVLREK
jgi:hypothetical protein